MSLKSRVFERSRALTDRLPAPLKSAHSFLWLHVLTADDLDQITLNSYRGKTGFESEDHNLRALTISEKNTFEQAFAGCKSILVAGAGGGREMIALARDGHEVTGFDISSDLVDACQSNLQAATVAGTIFLVRAGEVNGGSRVHDGLVIGRGVYHHIPGRTRRIRFLKKCGDTLAAGAPVVISDFMTRSRKRPLTAFAVSPKVEAGDAISSSFYHFFTQDEISTELDQAGFDLVDYRQSPIPGGGHVAQAIGRRRLPAVPG